MNQLSSIKQRVQAPTPAFFQKLSAIGFVLTAISGAILGLPLALPAVLKQIAGYMGMAATIVTAVSRTAVEDTAKQQEVPHE
jgi:hypothetical protein